MKAEKLKILVAAFEAEPFLKTGGLGDVAGSLPKALCAQGAQARLILPKFTNMPQEYLDKMKQVAVFETDLAWRRLYVGVYSLRVGGVTCYFIENDYYFGRGSAYGYMDDGERVAFFSKAVLDAIPYIKFKPDVLHCKDWHTALIPVLYKDRYEYQAQWAGIRTVFTIHNLRFQGYCPHHFAEDVLGLCDDATRRLGLEFGDQINFLRGALHTSDLLTTVSPTYANEIQTAFYGERAEGIFRARSADLHGILNGIDVKSLNPATDKALPAKFSKDKLSGKAACKAALQQELGLEQDPNVPLMVLISRLTEQKGLDLLLCILEELMGQHCQLAVLGTGYPQYEEAFRSAAARHPGKLAAILRFDGGLSRRMYAGADMALVPSLFEPCGLTQMMSMRYGALPVVRETGGLKDSVQPYNRYTGEGNGFSFANFNAHELLFTLKDAIAVYDNDRPAWDKLVQQAMETDFSWAASAKQYLNLFYNLCGREIPQE